MTGKEFPSLTLYRGFPANGKHVWSPFVNKLEARLRFEGVKYDLDPSGGSPRTAPRGKIPYVVLQLADGAPHRTMGDSGMIIRTLIDEGVLRDLNVSISSVKQAQDVSVRALMEDRAYFFNMRERWCDNYLEMRTHVLAAVPWPLQILVGRLAYRGIQSTLHGQGTGRLSNEEVLVLMKETWESTGILLRESKAQSSSGADPHAPFWVLGGDEPTEADATLFGFISSALICTAGPITGKIVRSIPILVEYADRIHDRYFPDYCRWPPSPSNPEFSSHL